MNTAECTPTGNPPTAQSSLQWSRRVNTAECSDPSLQEVDDELLQWSRRVNTAECAGVKLLPLLKQGLQWSRRVNTAEWAWQRASSHSVMIASMEPPCEHGGVDLDKYPKASTP